MGGRAAAFGGVGDRVEPVGLLPACARLRANATKGTPDGVPFVCAGGGGEI